MGTELALYLHLKQKLKVCRLTGKKDEIIIRCPYCGDSAKDPFKGHFYIMNRPPFKYYCQRCNTSGVTNSNLLQKLNVSDYQVVSMINKSLTDYQKKLSFKYGSEFKYFDNKRLNFYPRQYGELELTKMKYIEDRLGVKLEIPDIDKFKIILNLKDFFEINNIDFAKRIKSKKDKDLLNKLYYYTVGFLTADKNTIICRSLNEAMTGFRYHNYSLFPDAIESKKFFTVKKDLDLSLPKHKIIMTEGILDTIGVYNHIHNRDDEPLYVANNGKSFLFVLDYLASLSLLNVDIDIMSDAEVTLKFYKYVIESSRLARYNGLNIFYNQISKDYGVKKTEILLSEGTQMF